MRLRPPQTGSEIHLAESDRIAAALPDLLVSAERAAASLTQGLHGRRTAGRGESFWQYRRYMDGDNAANIDWRRSGRSDHHFIRENEWEAAHTVWLWVDPSRSMHLGSTAAARSKIEQAILIALSAAFLLSGAGEMIGAYGSGHAPGQTRSSVEALAGAILDMLAGDTGTEAGLPPLPVKVKPFSDVILISDFLNPLEGLEARLEKLAAEGIRGHLLQVLDPAEEEFTFQGRIEFADPEGTVPLTINRAEAIRADYLTRLGDHRAALMALARKMGWSFALHHTGQPAAQAVLQLHNALSRETS
mgnify:FL=1